MSHEAKARRVIPETLDSTGLITRHRLGYAKEKPPLRGAAFLLFNLRGLPHRVGLLGLRLQPVEIIGGLLRMAGAVEDGALVVLQNFEP